MKNKKVGFEEMKATDKQLEERIKVLEDKEQRREEWEMLKRVKHAISPSGWSEIRKIYDK